MTRLLVDDMRMREAVEAFVKERFAGTEILSVSLDEDFDRDGDRVIEIKIVVDATAKEIAQREPPGFLHALRGVLRGANETAFPIVRFKPVNA